MHSANDYCHPEVSDQTHRDDRLKLLDLEARDHETARRLQDTVIVPRLELIIAAFYDRLLELSQFQEIMARGFDINALRHTQSDYLRTLGMQFDSAAYFHQRLRVGLVHDRVGVPLSLYQCVYRLLQQLLIDHVRAAVSDPKEQRVLSDFVLKITTLDMSLAVEAYHGVRMTSLEQSLEQLGAQERVQRRLAQTDSLTGVANRAYLFDALGGVLDSTAANPAPLCLAVADLDHFKLVNDRYGHLTGDAVLRDVVARLRAGFRDFDLVGRYGGEEFAIVLANTSLSQAVEICERVRQRVAGSPVSAGALRIPVTVSFGVAQARAGDGADAIFERADRALYAAKVAGRNRVCAQDDAAGR